MSVRSQVAAKHLCECLDWRVTNLRLHKLLYLAHMRFLGERGEPLIKEIFEAWDYGPMEPKLYQKLCMFGAGPVMNVFPRLYVANRDMRKVIDEVACRYGSKSGGALVALTHAAGGAWAKSYKPSFQIAIPNALIACEYDMHQANAEDVQ